MRVWYRLRAFLKTKEECTQILRDAGDYIIRSEVRVMNAEQRERQADVLLSSALETLKQRDAEVATLKREKTQLESTVRLREFELEQYALWQERERVRIHADIAEQVAREAKSVTATPGAPRTEAPHRSSNSEI